MSGPLCHGRINYLSVGRLSLEFISEGKKQRRCRGHGASLLNYSSSPSSLFRLLPPVARFVLPPFNKGNCRPLCPLTRPLSRLGSSGLCLVPALYWGTLRTGRTRPIPLRAEGKLRVMNLSKTRFPFRSSFVSARKHN